ncbi:Hpt domain-containing protein [Magnetovibrio sp. PR-2]|uniref:Hpt domain-containing protein n=1 Tax=Magnetovibrio sp. PR-2 TaxID=3120356 RepID=UPI002FCE3525
MSTDPDLQMILADIRQDFIDNTRDKLDDLEEEIEALRQGDTSAEQHILEVKRVIHSIKGAGGSFGFPTISKVAHGLEDYLETSGDVSTVAAEDLMVFINTITDILIAGEEPDHELAHMMLRSLPTGRRQSGARALDKGSALMLMPRGVQRKIISQELAQLGYKVTIVEKPVEAIDMALTLHPDYVITTQALGPITGMELAWALQMFAVTRDVKVAVVTADDINEEMVESLPPHTTVIKKGPRFSLELMSFIRKAGK